MTIQLSQLKAAGHDQLKNLVERRHPDYQDKHDHWEFMELSYVGGRDWIDSNIFTYHKEGHKEFEKRKERAYRFPHSREVVSLVNKYVFKGSIERKKELPQHISDFWGASTLLKRPIEDLMNTISAWTSTFGRIWVVVDNNIPEDVVTEADRKASKGRTYAYFLKPQDVYDFEYDDDGELEWMVNVEFYRESGSPLENSGDVKQRYRIWTKEYTAVVSEDKTSGEKIFSLDQSSIKETNLGIVPVFPADHITTDDLYSANALIEDVAYLDRAVANYLSNLDVIIQDQTFSQLAIPYQGLLPSEAIVDGDDDDDGYADQMNHIQQMGTKRVFAYNAEGGVAPEFISPDVKQADIIMRAVSKIVGEIYHSIGMAGERTKEDNAAGIDNSSGVAKAYDFERLNAMLAAKARSLQTIEHNMIRIVNAWYGKNAELQDTENFVTYPQTFDVRNLADEMDNAQRLSVMNAPKSIRKQQMKRLGEKMFPQAEEKEIKDIHEDIEDEWLEIDEDQFGPPPTMDSTKDKPVPGKKNTQGENRKEGDKEE